jgi:hypothetical protein
VDEDDFTIIKINICLTWQPPNMIAVILAELELNLSQNDISLSCWQPDNSSTKQDVKDTFISQEKGESYEMFDMRYFR